MRISEASQPVISGVGVTSAIGTGKEPFLHALLAGEHSFSLLRRPGRQMESAFIGAEISEDEPDTGEGAGSRALSLTARHALATLAEAWDDAKLDEVDPTRIGLVVGGSNFQQRALERARAPYASDPFFIRPTYALQFMDTDLAGVCTERFAIRGSAYTLGAASASSQMATINAAQLVLADALDVCIALGPIMDLSYWECHGFRALGAMGSDHFGDTPDRASRPFDRDRDGFIFGEACGAVVLESRKSAERRGVAPYATVSGWATVIDGNRNPNPSLDGEASVISKALSAAGWNSADVDYVNPHGSGSRLGDETELAALARCGLRGAAINATKALTGHGLASAGVLEIIATLLQMKAGRLHPNRNLDTPLDPDFAWIGRTAEQRRIVNALTLSHGFGGINTALCLRSPETAQ